MKLLVAALTTFALLLPMAATGQAGYKTGGAYSDDAAAQNIVERRKKRVKGGSGCDDADDIREHAECR